MQNKVSVIEVKYIGDLEWIDAFDKSIITRILQSIKFSNEGVAKWDKFQNKSFGFEFIVPGNYKIIKEGKTEIVFADMDQSSTQGILTVRDTWSYDSKGLKACSDMGELTKDGEICLFKKEGRELVSIEGEGDLLSNSFFIASYVGSAAKRNALNSNIYPNQLYSVFQREVPKIEIKTLTTKDDEDIVFDRIIKSIKIY